MFAIYFMSFSLGIDDASTVTGWIFKRKSQFVKALTEESKTEKKLIRGSHHGFMQKIKAFSTSTVKYGLMSSVPIFALQHNRRFFCIDFRSVSYLKKHL